MRLFKKFSLDEQPDRDYIDPDVLENPKKKRTYKGQLSFSSYAQSSYAQTSL